MKPPSLRHLVPNARVQSVPLNLVSTPVHVLGDPLEALAWLAKVEMLAPAGIGVAPVATSIETGPPQGSLSKIGLELFGPFALPFEMTSLILLAAIVGAVVLARRRADS